MEQREYDNLVKNRDKARERIDKLLSEDISRMGLNERCEWVSLYSKATSDWFVASYFASLAKVEDK